MIQVIVKRTLSSFASACERGDGGQGPLAQCLGAF